MAGVDEPWCRKNTPPRTNVLSLFGVECIPSRQCPGHLNEACSWAIAVYEATTRCRVETASGSAPRWLTSMVARIEEVRRVVRCSRTSRTEEED